MIQILIIVILIFQSLNSKNNNKLPLSSKVIDKNLNYSYKCSRNFISSSFLEKIKNPVIRTRLMQSVNSSFENIKNVDHKTVLIQQGDYFQTNLIILTEESQTTNPSLKGNLMQIELANFVYTQYTPTINTNAYIPEPSCSNIANIVRTKNIYNSDNILFLRVSSQQNPIDCNDISNSLSLYYFKYSNGNPPVYKSTTNLDSFSYSNLQFSLRNFIIDLNPSSTNAMIVTVFSSQGSNNLGLDLINLPIDPLQQPTSPINPDNSWKYKNTETENYIDFSNKGQFLTDKSDKVYYIFPYFKKNSNSENEIYLKLIPVTVSTSDSPSPPDKNYLIFKTTEIILSIASTYDYFRTLMYLVVSTAGTSTGKKTRLYIVNLNPNNHFELVSISDMSLDNLSIIQDIKVVMDNNYNFIIAYGKGYSPYISDSTKIYHNLSIFKIDSSKTKFNPFNSIDINIETLDVLYDVIISVKNDNKNLIPIATTVFWYLTTSSNEVISRLINCPFFIGDNCQLGCDSLLEGENLNTKKCEKCYIINKYLYSNTCVDSCPYGYGYDINKKCKTCPSLDNGDNSYLDRASNKCVFSCIITPSTIVDETSSDFKVCSDCLKLKKFKRISKESTKDCVDNCNPSDFKDIQNGICYACQESNKFYYKNECIDQCPQGGIVTDPLTNECSVCSEINKLVNEDTCVSTCPPGKIKNPDKAECFSCQFYGLVNNKGVCKTSCDDYYGPDINNNCSACKDMNKFMFQKKCVDICPIYYVSVNQNCVLCKNNNSTFYYDDGINGGKCVNSCPQLYASDDNGICYQCHTRGLLNYNNTCVDECPGNTIMSDKKICKECPENYLVDRGNCEKNCSPWTYRNTTSKVCVHCGDFKKYLSVNKCVDDCPDYAAKNNFYYYCEPCYLNNMKYYNNTCLKECPEYSSIDNLSRCTHCGDTQQFYFNNTCVDICPTGTIHNYYDWYCIDNKPSLKFICQNDGIYDELNNNCICSSKSFTGKFCQYSETQVFEIMNGFEKLFDKSKENYDFKNYFIKNLYDESFVLLIRLYLDFVEEVGFKFISDKISSMMFYKLSLLLRFSTTNSMNASVDNLNLIDFALQIIEWQHVIYFNDILDKILKSKNDNEFSIKNNNSSLRLRSLKNILIDNKLLLDQATNFNATALANAIASQAQNTYTGLKYKIEVMVKKLIYLRGAVNFYFIDGKYFKIVAERILNGKRMGEITKYLGNVVKFNIQNTINNVTSNNFTTNNTINNTINNSTTINNTILADSTSPQKRHLTDITVAAYSTDPSVYNNEFSYYNISQCEEELRSKFPKTSKNNTLIALSIEYSNDINYDANKFNHISNSLSLQIFDFKNPISKTACSKIIYKLKVVKNPNYDNLIQLYHQIYKDEKINILDKDDEFFNNRCYRYINQKNSSFSYLTLQQRKYFYFYNFTSQCVVYKNKTNENYLCNFISIDKHFVTCECGLLGEVTTAIFKDEIPDFSNFNIDIIFCFSEVFMNSYEFLNNAFIFTTSCFISAFFLQILFSFLRNNTIDVYFDKVVENDCITLNFNENVFPSFYDLEYKNTVKFFQFQFENTILNELKNDLEKSNLLKMDRLKHLNLDIKKDDEVENNSISFNDKSSQIRKIREKFFTINQKAFSRKQYTLLDLDCIDVKLRLEYDNRDSWGFLKDYLYNYNIFFYTFFKKSLLLSQTDRIYIFILNILLHSLFNAIFYLDNMIENRSIEINQTSFIYTLTNEYTRLIISYLSTTYFILIIKSLLKIPRQLYTKFNVLLWTINQDIVKDGHKIIRKKLILRYFLYRFIFIIFSLFSIIYCSIFNAVYVKCVYGWLYGVLITITFDIIIVGFITVPLLALLSRKLAKKYK